MTARPSGAPASGTPGLDRRSVLKTAAWAVPVLAVAVAAPAATASGQLGRLAIESMLGGSWVDPSYYGASIQLRNDDTHATVLPVAPITSGILTVIFPTGAVGGPEPAVVVNDGTGPNIPALPVSDPGWTTGTASSNGDGTTSFTLNFAGSLAGQGVTRISFGIIGSVPLQSGFVVTATSIGSPSDGTVGSKSATLY